MWQGGRRLQKEDGRLNSQPTGMLVQAIPPACNAAEGVGGALPW
jgi:hypothetical protein